MKKKSKFRWFFRLTLLAGAVCALFLLVQKFVLPLLSDEIPENTDPEEDIFAVPEDKEERFTVISSDSHGEEKRQAKIRRGYIPLKFHEKAEA